MLDYLLLYVVLIYGLSLILYFAGFLDWLAREHMDVPSGFPFSELNVLAAPMVLPATLFTSVIFLSVWLLRKAKSTIDALNHDE